MAHIRDRWMKKGPNNRKIKTARYGKGARWQIRWDGGPDESFYSKDAAEARLDEIRSGVTRPTFTTATVAEYAEDWLSQQLHYTENSMHTAAQRLKVQIVPVLGHLPLAEVTRLDVQRAVVEWSSTLKPNSVRLVVSILRTMFRAAAEDKLIPDTPCVRINVPSRVRKQVVPLTREQVRMIADRVPERYRAMVILGSATGLRPSEMAGLTADHLVAGDAVVNRQLLRVLAGGAPVFCDPKSKSSFRRIAIGEVAGDAMKAHLERFPPGVEGLVFTTRQAGALRRTQAAEVWRNATEGMGLPPRTGWHALRHYHASVLIHAGRSPKSVAARMGHADASETLRTYAHLWPSDEAGLVATVDADLARILGPSGDRGASADHAA